MADGKRVAVLHAVDGDGGAGTEFFKGGADLDLGTNGIGLGDQEAASALEGSGEVPDFFGIAGVSPGEAGIVVLGGGVGVLTGDELEGVEGLVRPGVAGEEAMFADGLVEAEAGGLGVESLGGVGIEGAFVDVGAIGFGERPGSEEAIDLRTNAGIGREARAFNSSGNQDISVYEATPKLQVAIE